MIPILENIGAISTFDLGGRAEYIKGKQTIEI